MVNLDGRWGSELDENLDRYDRRYPGRFATFCQIDWSGLAERDFSDLIVAGLTRSAEAGAVGLKVWKDLGLHLRDHRGELVLPDDPRLADVWAAAGQLQLPIAIHTADPVAFFEPIDERNERYEQLRMRPDWSFADQERFPRFERLIEALEAAVAANPATAFIGVHVGCYPENLGWVSRMLDTYPNFQVDIAARIAELGRVPRATRELILRHPDRVLFGTDDIPPNSNSYGIHYRFLETSDEYFAHAEDDPSPMGRWGIYGLELPDHVLQKVYADNALRLVPRLGL
jgi:predicted TIM-barrel fold metal-dependent hydrolase